MTIELSHALALARDAQEKAEQLITDLSLLETQVGEETKKLRRHAAFVEKEGLGSIDKELFLAFFKKPYALIPHGRNSVLVAVPKFIEGFQVGWLWKETDNFYIYEFNQYSAWLGDAPADLVAEVGLERGLDAKVEGQTVSFSPEMRDTIKKKLGAHLKEVGDTSAKIVRGHEFEVIADIVKNGCLPFNARPVAPEDLREPKGKIKPRKYQKPTIERFLETGAVGAFHPTGAGKSFTTMHLIDRLIGEKHIIVPTRTLIEQWNAYIEQNIPHCKSEIRLFTYAGYREQPRKPVLTVYDECHKLPADTFSRMALYPTKYRLGLSASPHREDGREHYIFALTGFPVGLDWKAYMEDVGKSYHPILVHVVKSVTGKIAKVRKLLEDEKKTLIFCDGLDLGKKLASTFDLPFVHGDSTDRLTTIGENQAVIVSRVADEGISIKGLQRIIEVDFHGGSRRQELQRTGRLMHSDVAEQHDIIMTEAEISQHGKRLWSLQEKGFTVRLV